MGGVVTQFHESAECFLGGGGTVYCNMGMERCCRKGVVLGPGADGLVPNAWVVVPVPWRSRVWEDR
jgi:hypothetical protein